MADLAALDKIRRELEGRLPGWQVWFVPHSSGDVAWCARPWPLINAQTVEQLLAEVTQAHAEAPGDWPALASAEAYAAVAGEQGAPSADGAADGIARGPGLQRGE